MPIRCSPTWLCVVDDGQTWLDLSREQVLRHDVKAIEFNTLAGHEHVHKGMTGTT